MIAYAYVKKGIMHKEGVCEDTVLLGNHVLKEGFSKVALGSNYLVGVSDGVGGAAHGEFASGLTMLSLAAKEQDLISSEDVTATLKATNNQITSVGSSNFDFKGTAATLTLFGHLKDGETIWQFGNTRLYEIANWGMGAVLVQQTRDHNQYNDLLRAGLDASAYEGTRQGEILTTYMGIREEAFDNAVDIGKNFTISDATNRIFITSDGIHDHIPEDKLRDAMVAGGKPFEVLKAIIDLALECGSRDDLSVVLLTEDDADVLE